MTPAADWHFLPRSGNLPAALAAAVGVAPGELGPLALTDLHHPFVVPGVPEMVSSLAECGVWRVETPPREATLAVRSAAAILARASTGAAGPLAAPQAVLCVTGTHLRLRTDKAESELTAPDEPLAPGDDGAELCLSAPTLAFKIAHGLFFARWPGVAGEVVVLDLETTGLDQQQDEILEIAAVKLRHGHPVASFESLVRPQRSISPAISRINRITNELVAGAPPLEQVLEQFLDFLGPALVVAHNAAFDLSFLQAHTRRLLGRDLENPLSDTLALARRHLSLGSYGLEQVCRALGVALPPQQAHRAMPDCRATASVYLRLKALEQRPRLAGLGEALEVAALGNLDPGVQLGIENRRIAAAGLQHLHQAGGRRSRLVALLRPGRQRRPHLAAVDAGLAGELGALRAYQRAPAAPPLPVPAGVDAPDPMSSRRLLVESTPQALLGALALLAPFGAGNPAPLVRFSANPATTWGTDRLALQLMPVDPQQSQAATRAEKTTTAVP